MLAVSFLITTFIGGCRTQKVIEKEETKDSVRVEYRESVVYVPVTVTVEIPAQTAERETRDSTSHLETGFAQSDAAIRWVEGVPYLHHSLANKPQKIEHRDSVPVKEKYLTIQKQKYNTIYKTTILEKKLTLYQRAMIYLAPWIILGLLAYIVYIRLKH